MFSRRLDWDVRPNAISQLFGAKRNAGEKVLDLTQSNPTAAGLTYPADEILAALADPRSLLYEPAPAGLPHTRAAIANLHGVTPERIFVTASTSESYSYLFKALADPGDEILVPRPSYPLFEYLAALESLCVRQYSLVYQHGWFVDFDSLARAITSRTRAVVLVNPNNPTGSFVKRNELVQVVDFCSRHNVAIISDEVFSDYRFTKDPSLVASIADIIEVPVFALNGLSKMLGLPQMKLGWIILGGREDWRVEASERLELIADTYLSSGAPIQHAVPSLLALREPFQQPLAGRLSRNLALLRELSGGSPCTVLDVEGGWYAILEVPRTRTEQEWVLTLLELDGVLVQPGYFFDFEEEAFLVLSLLTAEREFAQGLERLLARITNG